MTINRFALSAFTAVALAGVATWTLEPGQAQDTMSRDSAASTTSATSAPDARLVMLFGPPSPVATSFVARGIRSENGIVGGQAIKPIVAADESETLDGVSIVRQSIRRAGLGSRTMAALVLRNDNDYAVKDIGLRCEFKRGDGQVSTQRVRTIERTLKPKSREALKPTLIGFINVMAADGKCSLTSASRV